MPALKNQRWERFCHGLLEGKPAVQAYQDAGYKRNEGNAIRLKGNEKVIARLAELKREAAEVATMDRAWVLQQMRDLYEKTTAAPADGGPTWSPATARGLLDLLGKELGMFVDRKIIGIKRLEDMGDDELRQIAGQVLEELDAQVTVDGDVRPVVAELLEPSDPAGGDNPTHMATHDDSETVNTNAINELDGQSN